MLGQKEGLDAGTGNGGALKRISANLLVLRKHNPVVLPGRGQPFNIGGVLREVIVMHLDNRTRVSESLCNDALAEAAVYKEDG